VVEQCPFKAWVAGSNPAALTKFWLKSLAALGISPAGSRPRNAQVRVLPLTKFPPCSCQGAPLFRDLRERVSSVLINHKGREGARRKPVFLTSCSFVSLVVERIQDTTKRWAAQIQFPSSRLKSSNVWLRGSHACTRPKVRAPFVAALGQSRCGPERTRIAGGKLTNEKKSRRPG
jgi:hypothetical protein